MSIREQISLHESYEYKVTINQGEYSFSGVLKLTPEKITLRIGGDATEDRRLVISFDQLDSLECHSTSTKYLLYGLRNTGLHVHYLANNPTPVRNFDFLYEIESVILGPTNLDFNEFKTMELQSETINKWIGFTTTQDQILASHYAPDSVPDELNVAELSCDATDLGNISIIYNIVEFNSLTTYGAGISFPPSLRLRMTEPIPAKQLMGLHDSTYNLFSALHGDELIIDKIVLHPKTGNSWTTGFLYYSTLKNKAKHSKNYSLYPLGRNLKFDTLGLPELPIQSISNYYELDIKARAAWSKYIKYRRMQSIEERFLGYFRLLEAQTYKSERYLDEEKLTSLCTRAKPFLIKNFDNEKSVTSFLARLPKFNNSKYNTEKCIVDFYKRIPVEAKKKLALNQSHIGAICKLRNDISHANDYHEIEESFRQKCNFVEALLIFSLFEFIGIPLSATGKIIDRLH